MDFVVCGVILNNRTIPDWGYYLEWIVRQVGATLMRTIKCAWPPGNLEPRGSRKIAVSWRCGAGKR